MTAAAEDSGVSDGLVTAPELVERLEAAGYGEWTAETLRQWIRHPRRPCPVAERGKPGRSHLFDPDAVMAWLDERETQAEQLADPAADLARQRARLMRLKADEAEGLLVPAEEVEAAMGRVVDATRTALLSLPQTLTDRLGLDDEQRGQVHAAVTTVLERLSRAAVDDADAAGDDPEEAPAP